MEISEYKPGMRSVAAPIFDCTGKVVGTVGCSAYTVNRDCDRVIERLLTHVLKTANEISMRLGNIK
jgi:DNA-binding IclR family transcriptional regulator